DVSGGTDPKGAQGARLLTDIRCEVRDVESEADIEPYASEWTRLEPVAAPSTNGKRRVKRDILECRQDAQRIEVDIVFLREGRPGVQVCKPLGGRGIRGLGQDDENRN